MESTAPKSPLGLLLRRRTRCFLSHAVTLLPGLAATWPAIAVELAGLLPQPEVIRATMLEDSLHGLWCAGLPGGECITVHAANVDCTPTRWP